MLTITAKAADKAKEIFKDKGLEGQAALRVFVAGGGCSGYQYGMALARQPDEDDFVIEHDGVKLVVDRSPAGGRGDRLRGRPDEGRLHDLQPERRQVLRLRLQLPDRGGRRQRQPLRPLDPAKPPRPKTNKPTNQQTITGAVAQVC